MINETRIFLCTRKRAKKLSCIVHITSLPQRKPRQVKDEHNKGKDGPQVNNTFKSNGSSLCACVRPQLHAQRLVMRLE